MTTTTQRVTNDESPKAEKDTIYARVDRDLGTAVRIEAAKNRERIDHFVAEALLLLLAKRAGR